MRRGCRCGRRRCGWATPSLAMAVSGASVRRLRSVGRSCVTVATDRSTDEQTGVRDIKTILCIHRGYCLLGDDDAHVSLWRRRHRRETRIGSNWPVSFFTRPCTNTIIIPFIRLYWLCQYNLFDSAMDGFRKAHT